MIPFDKDYGGGVMQLLVRIKEIREKITIDEDFKAYQLMIEFMKNPIVEVNKYLFVYLDGVTESTIIEEIRANFYSNRTFYREKIIYGQVIIWEEFLKTSKKVDEARRNLSSICIPYYESNYLKSTKEISRVLSIYAEAKAAITKLENVLGVDRYLDLIAQDDFKFLDNKLNELKFIADKILSSYKELYISKWSTTNVYDVVRHKLLHKDAKNQLCTMLKHSQKRVLLIIVDGFGAAQLLWSKKVVPQNTNFTYNENIFEWLERNHLSEEFILGAPLVSDTAAGLTQIFTGCKSKKTRVFSSNIMIDGNWRAQSTKKLNGSDFCKIADTSNCSITLEAASELGESTIYYCSKYDSNNETGFSNYIFDSSKVISIIPPERVFAVLQDKLDFTKEWLSIVYITSLDNSGHTMGAFSQFERYEHEKLNTILKNFLIQLAREKCQFFDGNTSIIITADHGMTESYKINISRNEINALLESKDIRASFVEDNRALFIYRLLPEQIDLCKNLLVDYFKDKGMNVSLYKKGDKLFDEFIPENDYMFTNTNPDIIVSLVSEGIFYSRNIQDNLMHFGGHGGTSIDEVFVPLINIELNNKLLKELENRFISLS
jgi:hypothetical protein